MKTILILLSLALTSCTHSEDNLWRVVQHVEQTR